MERIKIEGMSCAHCVAAVKSALEEVGLTAVNVDLDSGCASFTPTTAFSREQLTEAVEEAGFEVKAFE